jgi:hypothetical protein
MCRIHVLNTLRTELVSQERIGSLKQIYLATGYGLKDRRVGVRVPVESRFSLLHLGQTGSGTSYPMGTGGFSPGENLQGPEADNSTPTSSEVKKT